MSEPLESEIGKTLEMKGTPVILKALLLAFRARSSIMYGNNSETPSWEAAGMVDRGKLFAQLCIGFIEQIEVYVKNTAAAPQNLVLAFSYGVDEGEVFTKTLSCPVDAVGAWRAVSVREWWKYDKCFIWVKSSGANVCVAYDVDTSANPRNDEFVKGTARQALNRRLWLRLTLYGLPEGYQPVGGTVNAIIIPNVSGIPSWAQVTVGANSTTTILGPIYGAGEVSEMMFRLSGASGAGWGTNKVFVQVIVDGTTREIALETILESTFKKVLDVNAIINPIYYDDTLRYYVFAFNFKTHFLKSFELKGRDTTGLGFYVIPYLAYELMR